MSEYTATQSAAPAQACLPFNAKAAETRDILAAAFAGQRHPSMPSAASLKERARSQVDHQFPVLVHIMTAGAGIVVAKPGTELTAWVPAAEIKYVQTIETLGEVRNDKPNGRAIRYSVQAFSVTPKGRRILERCGLL